MYVVSVNSFLPLSRAVEDSRMLRIQWTDLSACSQETLPYTIQEKGHHLGRSQSLSAHRWPWFLQWHIKQKSRNLFRSHFSHLNDKQLKLLFGNVWKWKLVLGWPYPKPEKTKPKQREGTEKTPASPATENPHGTCQLCPTDVSTNAHL